MTSTVTFADRQTTRTGSHANQIIVLDHTDIVVDGSPVHTITWVPALLRRIEREGWTRTEYAARIASRYVGARS